jgi:PAS domain S-box-containing protein
VQQEIVEIYERHSRVFDAVLSAITDFAYIFDRNGRFLYANNALLNLWGLTLEAVVEKASLNIPMNWPRSFSAKFDKCLRAAKCCPMKRNTPVQLFTIFIL